MKAFIDDHRAVHGVEPICRVLPIAPSTYRAHAACAADPSRASARVRRDAALRPEIRRVWDGNFKVYGVRKVWRQLLREGIDVARCTVARLMRQMGLQGVVRGKPVKTTHSNPATPCPADHVNRQFQAPRPNALWVSDFTYVSTWSGVRHRSRTDGDQCLTLCGVRDRHLRPTDCRMAGFAHRPYGLCPGRLGAGPPRPPAGETSRPGPS